MRVVVSQRCDHVCGRDEVRDALDVRLSALLWECGFLPVPLASSIGNHQEYLKALMPDAIVLSGGNDIADFVARDRLEAALLHHAVAHHLPVLGICRGMQMMNQYQSGVVSPVSGHVALRHRIFSPIVGLNEREVNSYHNYGIHGADLGNDLEAVAWSDNGVVEALRHRQLPWLGIMWHPERDASLVNSDKTLIRRHLAGLPLSFVRGED